MVCFYTKKIYEIDYSILTNRLKLPVFKQLSKTDKHIEYYKNKFHIIVPIMSGHNPDVKDDFISFAADAIEIEDYILSRYRKEIYAVYGCCLRSSDDCGTCKGVRHMTDSYKVGYSVDALDDLREFYSYIANELLVPETATAQLSSIRKEVRSLDFMPARYALAPCHNHGT